MKKISFLVALISFCAETQASSTLGLPKKFDHQVFPREVPHDPYEMDLTKRPRLPRIDFIRGENWMSKEREARLDKWKRENPFSRFHLVEPHQNDDWARRRFDRDNISDLAKYPENHPYNLVKRNALWATFGFGAFCIGFSYAGWNIFNAKYIELEEAIKIIDKLTNQDKIKFSQVQAALISYRNFATIGALGLGYPSIVMSSLDCFFVRLDRKLEGRAPFFLETDRTAPLKITVCGLAGLAAGYAADSYLKNKLS